MAQALRYQPVQARQRRVRKGRVLAEQQYENCDQQGAEPQAQQHQDVHGCGTVSREGRPAAAAGNRGEGGGAQGIGDAV